MLFLFDGFVVGHRLVISKYGDVGLGEKNGRAVGDSSDLGQARKIEIVSRF